MDILSGIYYTLPFIVAAAINSLNIHSKLVCTQIVSLFAACVLFIFIYTYYIDSVFVDALMAFNIIYAHMATYSIYFLKYTYTCASLGSKNNKYSCSEIPHIDTTG